KCVTSFDEDPWRGSCASLLQRHGADGCFVRRAAWRTTGPPRGARICAHLTHHVSGAAAVGVVDVDPFRPETLPPHDLPAAAILQCPPRGSRAAHRGRVLLLLCAHGP